MRRYETIFILRPNIGEDEITKVIESTTKIILDEKGTVIELNKWGMKNLAYLIKKESLGYYVYCDYAGTPAAVAEIERKFRIDDGVLKYMTIKTAASFSDEEIQLAVTAVTEKEAALVEEEKAATEETEATETTAVEATEKTEEN
ncbi:MAG: 30S ribosomal protein S6 [Desulforhopalus sp.]